VGPTDGGSGSEFLPVNPFFAGSRVSRWVGRGGIVWKRGLHFEKKKRLGRGPRFPELGFYSPFPARFFGALGEEEGRSDAVNAELENVGEQEVGGVPPILFSYPFLFRVFAALHSMDVRGGDELRGGRGKAPGLTGRGGVGHVFLCPRCGSSIGNATGGEGVAWFGATKRDHLGHATGTTWESIPAGGGKEITTGPLSFWKIGGAINVEGGGAKNAGLGVGPPSLLVGKLAEAHWSSFRESGGFQWKRDRGGGKNGISFWVGSWGGA